jgi:hypothetical protein
MKNRKDNNQDESYTYGGYPEPRPAMTSPGHPVSWKEAQHQVFWQLWRSKLNRLTGWTCINVALSMFLVEP